MGKTSLAMTIAYRAAKVLLAQTAKSCVAFFSLEMSAEQLAMRLLSEETRIRSDRIRLGDIGQRDFDKFVGASREMTNIPLEIDDTPAITLSALRTRARRLKRTKGLSLLVIDYLQLMRPAAGTKPENRVLEIAQITQGLKAIAKELEVPVLALSQLSRAVESREDKRPQLADLRESGTIEQDADAVMFLYREEYYLAQAEPQQALMDKDKYDTAVAKFKADMEQVHNKADLNIAKQRHGPTGTIKLFFEAEFTRFDDLDTAHSVHDAG
jgi:replicative DNA helicase